jgi:hypothetical protein
MVPNSGGRPAKSSKGLARTWSAESTGHWDHPLQPEGMSGYTVRLEADDPAAAVWKVRELLEDLGCAGFEVQQEV